MNDTLFRKRPGSGCIAKERLLQMMLEDKTECSSENLEHLRCDIARAMAKYIPIDDRDVHICLKKASGCTLLFTAANITSVTIQDIH